MANEELDFPSEQILSCLNVPNAASSCSFDIDDFLLRSHTCNNALDQIDAFSDILGRTQACTHAHACNPVGPDKSHTHTCIHVHTQIMPTPNEVSDDTAEWVEKNGTRRPMGNREAVRKYREKKKAKTASLEDEVVRLRALNQHLMKRLQTQALLEAEVARLKCLLVDVRGRIEGEIGSFPYQKPDKCGDVYEDIDNSNIPNTFVMNPCNVQGNDQLYCLHHGSETAVLTGQSLDECGFENIQCLGNQDCGLGNMSTGNSYSDSKRRGLRSATNS